MEERRFASASLRLDGPKIIGFIAYNSLSGELPLPNGRTYRERLAPGVFTRSLASGDDTLARYEHDKLLGRRSNGTLRITEDPSGLHFEIDPPDTAAGRDLVALIRRGDIRGSSFAFKKIADNWSRDGATLIRELRAATLLDVSPVARPAYLETSAALRSLAASPFGQPSAAMASARRRLALAERQ